MKKVYIVENEKTKEKGIVLNLKQRRKASTADRSHIYEEFKYKTSKVLLSRQILDTKKGEKLWADSSRVTNIMPLRLVSTRWRILSIDPPKDLIFEKDNRPTLKYFLESQDILDSIQNMEVSSEGSEIQKFHLSPLGRLLESLTFS